MTLAARGEHIVVDDRTPATSGDGRRPAASGALQG